MRSTEGKRAQGRLDEAANVLDRIGDGTLRLTIRCGTARFAAGARQNTFVTPVGLQPVADGGAIASRDRRAVTLTIDGFFKPATPVLIFNFKLKDDIAAAILRARPRTP